MNARSKRYTKIGVCIAACLSIGLMSSAATQSSVDTWYASLEKPGFTPPNWLFAPVWTVLYILMGWAAGLVWARGLHHTWVKTGLYLFGLQLLLNGSWSLVFFGLREPTWALFVLIGLLTLIGLTMKWFRIASRTAALMLLPYFLWGLYAAALNLAIVRLN